MAIQKAVRYQRKLRVGAGGPTGAGKTYTTLKVASYIASKTDTRVGLIDTENYSSSVYADEFDFDVIALTNFSPDDYIRAIEEFERSGQKYILIIDSLSHAWMGKGGSLDQVDKKVLQGKDSYTAWRTVTPQHNRLVEKIVGFDGHLFLTMRSKMEHALEKDERTGKNTVVKLGMAPVMRDGIEYEVDVYFDLDQDHNLTVSKTRFTSLDGYQVHKAGDDLADRLWKATQGEEEPDRPVAQAERAPADTAPQSDAGPTPAGPTNPDRLGQFAKPDGTVNLIALLSYAGKQDIRADDLSRIAPHHSGRGFDPDAWLSRNPSKNLMDLVAEAKEAKEKVPA